VSQPLCLHPKLEWSCHEDPETIFDPSGENATELIKSSWPRSGGSLAPVLASQTRMVLSSDPETIFDPSGENATELNIVIMASKWWECLSALCLHPKLEWSCQDPETIFDPSGENATEPKSVIMALEWRECLSPCACIPNSNGLVQRTLRQFLIHHARMQRMQSPHHGLEGVGASRCQCLHPKLEWSCQETPR
jgi:hypothetical protein